jgi:type VI secretion system secreted protein VgrG
MASTITISTIPISDSRMSLVSLEGTEALSSPFDYTLRIRSMVASVSATSVLGSAVCLTFTQSSGTQYLHGIATEFSQDEPDGRQATLYTLRLRPSFWLLSMHSAYTVYQNQTVVQIVQEAFSARGFSTYTNSLTKTYTPLVYVVQYGESSMDFVARLLEDAGIFYFFKHTASGHTLVLADDASTIATVPGTSSLVFGQRGSGDTEFILRGRVNQKLVQSGYQVLDYNFTTPTTSLMATSGPSDTYQLAEYPGGHETVSAGQSIAELRLSALEVDALVFKGSGICSNFHVGYQFTLTAHPNTAMNIAWLIKSMKTMVGQDQVYRNHFEAIPAKTPYLPARVTPRPRVAGTQTAIVTGTQGQEVTTDSYGRVQVQFPWDTSTAGSTPTSCWVRVAQVWAGKAWGSHFTPRIGQEVVISYINGDPAQPLVVGTVYNAAQTVPYALPANQTRSGIMTNSSTGGNGYNELRFEDKAGSEEVYLQAQQDLNIKVVKGNYGLTVATGNETSSVKGTRAFTVTGDETITNSANFERDVSGNYTLKVTGNLSIQASGSVSIESGTSFAAKAGTSMSVQGGTSVAVQAGTSLTAKGGTTMELEGGISGTINGGAQLAIKGGLVQIN